MENNDPTNSPMMLELRLELRQDGTASITSLCDTGVPPAALPTMIRGLLSTALMQIPNQIVQTPEPDGKVSTTSKCH